MLNENKLYQLKSFIELISYYITSDCKILYVYYVLLNYILGYVSFLLSVKSNYFLYCIIYDIVVNIL